MTSASAILWFRQDLRLLDNPALHAALNAGGPVLPVYVLPDGQGFWSMGGASRWWLHHSLAALSAALAEKGAQLILRRGDPALIIPELAESEGASGVHATICPEPHWRDTDKKVATALGRTGRTLDLQRGSLFDPEQVKTRTGGIYGMFTPFANAVRAMPPPRPPLKEPAGIPGPAKPPKSDKLESWGLLPTRPDWSGGLAKAFEPGEAAARARGRTFLRGAVKQYDTGRNLPGQDLTSRLSPHLHWGELSANSLWHAVGKADRGAGEHTFVTELIWRDFAAYLLWHHPSLPDEPLRKEFEKLPWRDDRIGLRAWQRGQTGVPVVDAGMRQLWQTGWMHNRVRMIVASFLIKHLLIDWRAGAAWFWDTLVDADLAANSMNWQWSAGSGIDSQPFFRVFNPVGQGEKFDADGAYVRHYVPEIAKLPDRFLHAPWLAPETTLSDAGVSLGRTYPKPLIDLAEGRTRALALWKKTVRGGDHSEAAA